MQYKYAFIDLDGTLLNSHKKITNNNLEALKNFVDFGGKIILITGRWPVSAFFYNNQIEQYTKQKNLYLVSLNGSLIYDLKNNQTIKDICIEDDIWKKLILFRKKFKLGLWIYFKKGIKDKTVLILNIPFKRIISYFNLGKVLSPKNVNNITDVYKILFLSLRKKKIDKAFNWLKQYMSDYLEVIKTSKYNLEITAKNTDKGEALIYLSNLLKINKNEIVCFGDSGNDVPMFKQSNMNIAINPRNENLVPLSNHVVTGKDAIAKALSLYVFPQK